jgi:hypothetical protein
MQPAKAAAPSSPGSFRAAPYLIKLVRLAAGVDTIDKRWMVLVLTASVAHACCLKGIYYLQHYPGWPGWTLFAACPFTAIVVGINLLELTKQEQARKQ